MKCNDRGSWLDLVLVKYDDGLVSNPTIVDDGDDYDETLTAPEGIRLGSLPLVGTPGVTAGDLLPPAAWYASTRRLC